MAVNSYNCMYSGITPSLASVYGDVALRLGEV